MTATLAECWISSEVIRSLVNWAAGQGLSRPALFAAVGVDEDRLHDANHHFSASDYARLMSWVSSQLDDPLCGFHFGAAAEPDRWGILGHIMSFCANLGEALQWQQRYQSLVGNIGTVTQHLDGPCLRLVWEPRVDVPHHMVEEVMAGWVAFARWITGTGHGPLSVHHRHDRAETPPEMQQYYDCNVVFGADFNGLVVPATFLLLPLKQPNKAMLQVMNAHAQQRLAASLAGAEGVGLRLREYIGKVLPEATPSLDAAAQHLCISPRTLQRRLDEADVSFRDLVDRVRRDQALAYLQTHPAPNLIELTLTLGFSSQSTLTRAFQRWTGQTPSQYLQARG